MIRRDSLGNVDIEWCLTRWYLWMAGFILILVAGILLSGPAKIYNHTNAWFTEAYGSDWLVVQYSANGDVIHHWILDDVSVSSESSSDGIYFTTPSGVVHLSGNYIYVQHPSDTLTQKLLRISK